MTTSLLDVGTALFMLTINILIYACSYDRNCSLALGARIFTVLAFVAFIVASFALCDIALHACIYPQETWPRLVLEMSIALLLGATLGAVWLWIISRQHPV